MQQAAPLDDSKEFPIMMKAIPRRLFVMVLMGMVFSSAAFAQKIIVNEFYRVGNFESTDEFIELLIVQDMTAAELNGFFYGDSTSTPNSKFGAYQLTNMGSIAANFPKGTIIVVGADSMAPAADTSYNPTGGDWNLVLKYSSGYVTKVGSTGDLAATDVAWVDTVATGETISADGFAVGWGTNTGTLRSAANVDLGTIVLNNSFTYLTSNLAGATTAGNWTNSTVSGTPGEPNGGDNSTYIIGLRGTAADDPDASVVPSGVSFGKTKSDATKDKVLTIKNNGAAQNLQINSPGLNFSGTNPDKFAIVGSPSFPITLTPGQETTLTVRYTPGEVAAHSASATLVSNDPNNPTISLSGEGIAVTDVANIAAARAEATGSNVRITGNVVVTVKTNGLNTGRGQFFVQDTSGADGASAIWIDDVNNQIGQLFDIGDQLTGIVGTLGDFSGMIQIVPIDTCTKVGTVAPPAPRIISSADTTFADFQGELIRINGVTIDAGGDTEWGGGAVGTGKNYVMTGPSGIIVTQVRLEEGSGLVGQPILTGPFDLVGIAVEYGGTNQIQPRLATDQTQATSVSNWSLY
jgi:hypothetical protein